ncbi:MAG: metallophosphoesterase, partial [Leeuwenhoekiella sp.]|nr:metallophosphoesterase [Leeuwenhoekiella sp.]
MNSSHLSRRNSLKLFALTGTTILAMPNLLLSCDSKRDFKIRFGILTDSHYANREPVGTRFYKDSIPKMREAIATLSTQKLDFLIHLGDFKDQDAGAKTEDTLGYLKEIEAVFQEFEGANYHALGNHDVD